MSIVTLQKPVHNVAESDWYYKVSQLKEHCENLRRNAFIARHESRILRNNTDITTKWSTHRTNYMIVDRRAEIIRWKNVIESCCKHLQKQIEDLKKEKILTEEVIEFLNFNFKVTNHCLSFRDQRGVADYCHDAASIELKTEQENMEKLKQSLTELCRNAWEQINKLEELRVIIAKDMDTKNHTIEIDTELLELTIDSANISLKPDALDVSKESITHEKWLQQCNNIKQRVENELVSSKKINDNMSVLRGKTKNDTRAQDDKVNFALRKRIYETDRVKTELEWQKVKMIIDKDKFTIEIENLENALDSKLNSKKLVETRCEARLYRVGAELCFDQTTSELHQEYAHLVDTIRILTAKLSQTKGMLNKLVEQVIVIEEDLNSKTNALKVDQKCLDYRKHQLQVSKKVEKLNKSHISKDQNSIIQQKKNVSFYI